MDIPVGRFGWFDYLTHDIAAAQKFFAQVFGWTTQTMVLGATKYPLIAAGNRYIGGYGAVLPGTPVYRYSDPYSKWMPYVPVANAHEAAGRVKQCGGKMVREPAPFGDLARMAIAADASGQSLAVWQPQAPSKDPDPGWDGPVGTFCWAELYTPNSPGEVMTMMKLACGFTATKSGAGDGTYYLLERDGKARAGIRTPMPGMPPGWFAWVRVASTDVTVAKAQQLGAEVHLPPVDVGSGRMALITDPFGAALGILQPR
jgi:uncharacterized protein